jgi:peptidoglycan/LPS O-acetylase OafA/YrhL
MVTSASVGEVSELDEAPATPVAGTRKRLDHIDAMRPIKQAAVISTHTLIFFAPLATSTAVVGLVMVTRFSREAFLFVSACMLAYSYKDTQKVALNHYIKRRFLSIGVPYLAWTVIYFLFTTLTHIKGTPYSLRHSTVVSWAGYHYFVHLLLTGYYHLYYLLVIGEFYVLFPLLLKFIRRFSRWHSHIMVVAVLWQIAFGVMVSANYFGFSIPGFLQTRLITSYPVYIIGGVIVALHLDAVHQWICDKARWIIALTLLSGVGAEVLCYLGRHSNLSPFLRTGGNVYAPGILPFNVGAILCVYLLGVHLVSPERRLRTRAIVKSGSDNSYGVYLSQMLWIPILMWARSHIGVQIPWPVAAPLALVLVYFMGYFFTGLITRTPLARAVAGRGQQTWGSLIPKRYGASELLKVETGDGPMDVESE